MLQEILQQQQSDFNASTVGQSVPVLFERAGRHADQLVGRSPYNQAVHVAAPGGILGTVADVTIDSCLSHSLAGVLTESGGPAFGGPAPVVAERAGA